MRALGSWAFAASLVCGAASARAQEAAPLEAPPEPAPEAAPAEPDAAAAPKKKTKRAKKKSADGKGAKKAKAARVAQKPASPSSAADDASDDGFSIALDARLGAGASSGDGVYDLPAALTVVGVGAEPRWTLGFFEASAPVELKHRETWGVPLRETQGRAALDLDVKPWKLMRASASAGVTGVARPAWPDPYQPDAADERMPTDRYSHVDAWAQARLSTNPARHHYGRLTYRFERSSWARDPAFDELLRPNHLTPQDSDTHSLDATWRYLDGPLHLGLSLAGSRQDYFWVFARDALTGETHAGPGGDPPNPLLSLWGIEAEPSAEWPLLRAHASSVAALSLGLAWRVRGEIDTYQGYYTRLENRVAVDVEGAFGPQDLLLTVDGKLAVTSRVYADTAYAAGGRHPPLDFGDRREGRVASLSVVLRFPARALVHAFATLDLDGNQTNFPDYEPGVYPPTQRYALDRDYQRAMGVVGVEIATPD